MAGKMELLSPKFFPAVTALLDAAPLVIGTLPVARYGRTIPQVGYAQARACACKRPATVPVGNHMQSKLRRPTLRILPAIAV